MADLLIVGGRKLSGSIGVEGNKNAALPLLAACLLTTETCEIRNVPRIRDVAVMVDLLESLGATVEGKAPRSCASPAGTSTRPSPTRSWSASFAVRCC